MDYQFETVGLYDPLYDLHTITTERVYGLYGLTCGCYTIWTVLRLAGPKVHETGSRSFRSGYELAVHVDYSLLTIQKARETDQRSFWSGFGPVAEKLNLV